jgi:O-antigen biosynthesis protein WbqP
VKNIMEILMALILIILLSPLMILISIAVKVTSKGPILYWSNRVGKDNKLFMMPKYRTMATDTPAIATHLLKNPQSFYTTFGKFLRQSSLDEIPQLISIIRGEMKFIGPRPALFNQNDLIKLRTEKGIQKLKPGVTGWAQINGRDDISIEEKVKLDYEYLNNMSLRNDISILWNTVIKVVKKDSITH